MAYEVVPVPDELKLVVYIVRDYANNYEMAPIFDHRETAIEICVRANSNTRFFNRIPVVPIGSPIPRPDDIRVQVPKDATP